MKTIKFFTPIIWVMSFSYVVSFFIDMMNSKSTMASYLGTLGIILILYLSYRTRLGLNLITKKQKSE